MNGARRHAWAQPGPLFPVRIADQVLEGVTCIRLDTTPAGTRCAHPACWIEEAHVTELTGLLREGPDGTS